MALSENRRRNSKRKHASFRALWGGLFHKTPPGDDVTHGTLFDNTGEDEVRNGESQSSLLHRVLSRINPWKLLALLLYILFIGSLIIFTAKMWRAQDISDIEGYGDNVPSRNLTRLICNKTALGEPIIIREDDVNRYLRDTCRMKQDGFFSIFAECHGVAFRFHKGYAEFIIDRGFGPLTRHTATVNITFNTEMVDGQPQLCAKLHGGEPIMGSMPRGGSMGHVPIPQRHIVLLQPALESLRDCYPEIRDAVIKHGYCLHFEDGRVELHPYHSQQTHSE